MASAFLSKPAANPTGLGRSSAASLVASAGDVGGSKLGAKGVLVGRPLLWGLAVDGQAGAEAILDILIIELDNVMRQSGCPTISDITPDMIFEK